MNIAVVGYHQEILERSDYFEGVSNVILYVRYKSYQTKQLAKLVILRVHMKDKVDCMNCFCTIFNSTQLVQLPVWLSTNKF